MSDPTASTTFNRRRPTVRHARASFVAAAAAVFGLSLLLSLSPVLGANNGNGGGGNGGGGGAANSGTVKVHDADTGLETDANDNDPHVCDFWLGFHFADTYEAGSWAVVSSAPTGDGSTVASGLYDTSGDGVDQSDVLSLDPGHYRVEWQANGAHSSKNKVLWVDEDCDGDEVTEPEDSSPAEEPEDSSPAEEPEDSSPAEEPEDSSPAEEPEDSSPAEQAVEPADVEEPTQPEEPVQAEEPEATDPGTPEGGTLDGHVSTGGDAMPDTSLPSATGVLTAAGLLLLILGHAIVRRTPHAKR